jgi:hypothetical protein
MTKKSRIHRSSRVPQSRKNKVTSAGRKQKRFTLNVVALFEVSVCEYGRSVRVLGFSGSRRVGEGQTNMWCVREVRYDADGVMSMYACVYTE